MATELYSIRLDEEDMGRLLLAVEVRRAGAGRDEREDWSRILDALREAFQTPEPDPLELTADDLPLLRAKLAYVQARAEDRALSERTRSKFAQQAEAVRAEIAKLEGVEP